MRVVEGVVVAVRLAHEALEARDGSHGLKRYGDQLLTVAGEDAALQRVEQGGAIRLIAAIEEDDRAVRLTPAAQHQGRHRQRGDRHRGQLGGEVGEVSGGGERIAQAGGVGLVEFRVDKELHGSVPLPKKRTAEMAVRADKRLVVIGWMIAVPTTRRYTELSMLNADHYAPDPVYQRHVAQHIAALNDVQVTTLLAQLADRWRRPDDVVPDARACSIIWGSLANTSKSGYTVAYPNVAECRTC